MASLRFFPAPGPEEQKWRAEARAFLDRFVRPTVVADDEACRFRREAFDEAARRGLAAVALPREHGGSGESWVCHYAVLEEISRVSLSLTVTVGVTNLVQGAILRFGSAAQKERYLRPLAAGKLLGAFSLSEPQSGSDAASLRLAAKPAPGGWRLTGNKCWCSTAGHADLYLVMARTGEPKTKGITAFLVPNDAKGFRVGKEEKKLGLRSSSLCELVFEDCFVPVESRVGEEGQGLEIALSQLDAGRITIGTAGLGVSIEALERAWRWRTDAERGGRAFDEGVRQLFGGHFAEIQSLKSLLREAALCRDRKEKITAVAAAGKLLGSDLAMRVTSDAVTAMGEAGYARENEVERMMRDAKALQIVEGTNQIQRLVLAREIQEALA